MAHGEGMDLPSGSFPYRPWWSRDVKSLDTLSLSADIFFFHQVISEFGSSYGGANWTEKGLKLSLHEPTSTNPKRCHLAPWARRAQEASCIYGKLGTSLELYQGQNSQLASLNDLVKDLAMELALPPR